MSLVSDIAASYRDPAGVMRRRLAGPMRDDRAAALLFLGCLLGFVGQWPRLAREASVIPEIGLDIRIGAALFGWIFVAPLLLYTLAALSHLAGRLFGARGNWYGARLALFWAIVAAAPLWLLQGVAAGFVPGIVATITGLAALAAFLIIWGRGYGVAEFGDGAAQ